jgi:hypothetical protein
MKKTLWIAAFLLVLLGAYTAWPYKGLYELSRALQARNAAALAENIHLPTLRRSVSEQVLLSYAKLIGASARLGPFEQMAGRFAANMADPLVSQTLRISLIYSTRGGLRKSRPSPSRRNGEEYR